MLRRNINLDGPPRSTSAVVAVYLSVVSARLRTGYDTGVFLSENTEHPFPLETAFVILGDGHSLANGRRVRRDGIFTAAASG
jgi:hypothetical protein